MGTGAPWKMPGEPTESIGDNPIELLRPLGGALLNIVFAVLFSGVPNLWGTSAIGVLVADGV